MVPTSKAGTWTRNKVRGGATRRAFTLVELIVVLIVVGICATVVFPKVSGLLLREPEPRRSGRLLARLVRHAQELAVATESTFVFSLEGNTGNYWIASKQQDPSMAVAALADLRGRLGQEVTVTNVELTEEQWDPTGPVTLEFTPEGTGDPARITLTSTDGRCVSVVIGEWSDEIELVGDGVTE
jgi:type II secretion system protein H